MNLKTNNDMSKLEILYDSIRNLEQLGLPINDETRSAVDQLEEQLIKDEILPTLSKNVEPMLSQIRRQLVLLVEYQPGEPIRVALTRKVRITDVAGTTPLTANTPVSPQKPESTPSNRRIVNFTKGLRVTFADGTVVWHNNAITTYVQTLRKIGFERVAQLGLYHAGYPIVSREKAPVEAGRIFQHECDGWYIWSNISNKQKTEDLETISSRLNLGLTIEEGKPQ